MLANKLNHTFFIALFGLIAFFCHNQQTKAEIVDNGEYYIVNEFYDKVLGMNESRNPSLSDYGFTGNTDEYIWIAETSSSEGYYYLKNKASNSYLKASTSNSYSVGMSSTKGTGNEFLWKFDVQFGKSIVNKRNTSTRLGCDWSTGDYVSVYYDKAANSRARFHVFPAIEDGYKASLEAAETDVYTSSIGVQEKDYYCIKKATTINEKMDVHLISADKPLSANINMTNGSWLIFENVKPSVVIEKYLKFVKKNGATAKNGTNVRVGIYLDGTVVMPYSPTANAFIGYTGEMYTGDAVKLRCKNNNDLGKNNNTIRSFTLQRGYMAVVANGTGGSGNSRVYVADHADLEVPVLPDGLNRQVSSVNVRNWQYISKKGWCSTQSTSGILGGLNTMNATWYYSWSADRNSTDNCEYVPIKQHLYWPSWTQINGLTDSNHVLSFNEPEHSEQHDNECDCGGTISSWTATTKVPDFYESGMRIGSPAPTDMSYLTEFAGHVDDMAYRCDFVALHAYWGPNEANGVSEWYNLLKDVHDKTGRPIWITEWAYGASWTSESWPSNYSDQLEKNRAAIMDIVDMLERTPWIERYSYYQWDTNSRRFINDDGWVTPAGQVYQKTKSTFAYNAQQQKAPNYWKPGNKTPKLSYTINDDGTITFNISNVYGDVSDELILQRRSGDGQWEDLYAVTDRYKFDESLFSYTMNMSDIDKYNDVFRIYNTTIFGGTSKSAEVSLYSFIKNPDCDNDLSGWTTSTLETNTGEASDDDGSNKYWNQWKANGLNSSMSQTINDLPAGEYTLSALLRGSTNCQLTLTAEVIRKTPEAGDVDSATSKTYGHGNTNVEGSAYQNGWDRIELNPLTLREGDGLKITATGYAASGSTWWSADHFVLKYVPAEAVGISDITADSYRTDMRIYTLDGRRIDHKEAIHGIFIQNGKKIIK